MAHRRLNVADRLLYETLRNRVGASLQAMRERRRLVSGAGEAERGALETI